jgi:hypothetical protein
VWAALPHSTVDSNKNASKRERESLKPFAERKKLCQQKNVKEKEENCLRVSLRMCEGGVSLVKMKNEINNSKERAQVKDKAGERG